MQIIESLVCLLLPLLVVGLFILAERHKQASLEKRLRNRESLQSEQKMIQGKASDDATPPYFFS